MGEPEDGPDISGLFHGIQFKKVEYHADMVEKLNPKRQRRRYGGWDVWSNFVPGDVVETVFLPNMDIIRVMY